jgi:hypothetical protein
MLTSHPMVSELDKATNSSPAPSRTGRPGGTDRASVMIADRCASVIRRLRPHAGPVAEPVDIGGVEPVQPAAHLLGVAAELLRDHRHTQARSSSA